MNLAETLKEQYGTVSEKRIEVASSIDSKKIKDLLCITRKYLDKLTVTHFLERDKVHSDYSSSLEELKISLTPEEITAFSIESQRLQDHLYFGHIGFALSLIIKDHQLRTKYGGKYKIVTEHFENDITGLCYKNNALVDIYGTGGIEACQEMQGGIVTIFGNVTSLGTFLKDGEITCHGSVEQEVGYTMHGGIITVKENARSNIGSYMTNGIITVQGDVSGNIGNCMQEGLIITYGKTKGHIGNGMYGGKIRLYNSFEKLPSYFRNGKIYHNDRLIFSRSISFIEKVKKVFT